jgi:glycerophosphoryl diester phosphodiesterase
MRHTTYFRFGYLFLTLALWSLFFSCQKDPETTPPAETTVKFLGHKGSGNSSSNPSVIENTLPAIQKGIETLSGVELDLQMSLDGTLWLFHDTNLATSSCTSMPSKTIILSSDTDISKIKICSSKAQERIYRLSEILSYWNQAANPFYISLHIKLDFPADSMNKPAIGGEAVYLAKMADNLAKIIPSVKAPGKIILEVYDATFCKRIHQLIPGIKVCLIKEVTFPKQASDALALGYDGVSCIFSEPTLSAAEVAKAQSNGLLVQLWTPDSKVELDKTHNLLPDFIQTNNLNAPSDLNLILKK